LKFLNKHLTAIDTVRGKAENCGMIHTKLKIKLTIHIRFVIHVTILHGFITLITLAIYN
jgi:hypothetical protein